MLDLFTVIGLLSLLCVLASCLVKAWGTKYQFKSNSTPKCNIFVFIQIFPNQFSMISLDVLHDIYFINQVLAIFFTSQVYWLTVVEVQDAKHELKTTMCLFCVELKKGKEKKKKEE